MNDAHRSSPPARGTLWERWGSLTCGLLLVAGTLAVYWPVTGFDFVNFDDPFYVTDNSHVRFGITWAGLQWALQTSQAANWHPVTWLSHMVDCQLYGPKAGGHHLTSLLLHVGNAWLLFALLLRLTGRRGRSFVVAALFAWHPLHVESVAWIAERKDVLSTCFFMLTLWAYVRYVEVQGLASEARSPQPGANHPGDTAVPSSRFEVQRSMFDARAIPPGGWYVAALFLFALGLMSKPMLVTLPFVLLLLDYWPLGRSAKCEVRSAESGKEERTLRPTGWGRLLLEKAPFLLLAALSCGVTVWAQSRGNAITAVSDLPVAERIANAVLSYYRYIGKTVWPTHLAADHPYGHPELNWPILLAGAALVGCLALALRLRKYPYVATGWFWFAGMLVPVIGLVQVGAQAMADRYSYLPSIGLFILAVFGLSDLAARFRHGPAGLAVMTGLALAGCLAATQRQVGYWRNSEALYRHALAVTQENFAAANNLGTLLFAQDKKEEAVGWYRTAVRWMPTYADAHCNLAIAYAALKRSPEARAEFQTALQLNPKRARTHYFLANLLLAEGETAVAEQQYQTAVDLQPDYPEAHYELAVVLQARGMVAEASQHLREAIRLKPDWEEALNNLAWLLATQPDARFRDGRQAVALAARAVALSRTNDAASLDTLGSALAEAGRFPEALAAVRLAARLAQAPGAAQLAREIEAHRQCYERGQPLREASPPATNLMPK